MEETLSQQSVLNKSSIDKFLLVLNLPPILKTINLKNTRANDKIDLDKIQFSVEGSIVPEVSIPSQTIPFGGQNLAVTSLAREVYSKNRVRFTIDNRFTNYWMLWKWLNVLNDSKTSTYNHDELLDTSLIKTLHNYQTDLSVYAMDEYNNKTVEFKYYKAFITKLGGIEYDYEKPDKITSYFEYDYSQLHVELL